MTLGETVRREIVGCVKPGGRLLHIRRKRLLLGREKLALQGVFPDPILAAGFSSANEGELGGNAFCAPNFLAVFASVLYGLGVSAEFKPHLRLQPSGTPCFSTDSATDTSQVGRCDSSSSSWQDSLPFE